MKPIKIFIVIFVLHQIIQNTACSRLPGNVLPGQEAVWAKYVWGVTSLPISLLPISMYEVWGMFGLVINSLIWAGVITLIIHKVKK